MVEREHRSIEHEDRIIDAQVIAAPIRNILHRPNHVVTKVTDGAACKWREIRNAYRMESLHCGAKVLHEIGRLPVPIPLEQKRVSAQKRVPCDSFSPFNTLQQESVGAVFLQLQKCRDGRQKIGDNRFIDWNDISLRLKFFNFFQAWLHILPKFPS